MNKYIVDRWNEAELIKTDPDDRRRFDERDELTIEDLFDVVFSLQEQVKTLRNEVNTIRDSVGTGGMVDPDDE